ncbi:hypothetical protein [Thermococcus sp.]
MGRTTLSIALITTAVVSAVAIMEAPSIQRGSYVGAGVAFTPTKILIFSAVLIATVTLVTYELGSKGEYADVLYLIAVSALSVWVVNSPPGIPNGFLSFINSSLSKFGIALSKETLFYTHLYVLLLLITALFYTSPRHSREFGFLTVGMTFTMPVFRDPLYQPSTLVIGVTAFALSLAISTTLVFSVNPVKSFLQTLALSFFTVIAIVAEPWNVALPIAFVLTFPRKRRDLTYITLVTLGIIAAGKLGLLLPRAALHVPPKTALVQSLLPVLVLAYVFARYTSGMKKVIRNTKGPTPFLLLLSLAYLVATPFETAVFPYLLLTAAALASRSLYHTRSMGRGRGIRI